MLFQSLKLVLMVARMVLTTWQPKNRHMLPLALQPSPDCQRPGFYSDLLRSEGVQSNGQTARVHTNPTCTIAHGQRRDNKVPSS